MPGFPGGPAFPGAPGVPEVPGMPLPPSGPLSPEAPRSPGLNVVKTFGPSSLTLWQNKLECFSPAKF